MEKINPKLKKALTLFLVALFWLGLWQIIASVYDMEFILPGPIATLKALYENIITAEFWQRILSSTVKILGGFFLASAFSLALSLLAIRFKIVKTVFDPFSSTIRAVPVASFIIFVLVLFSSQNVSLVIAFLMGFPVIYSTVSGSIPSVSKKLIEAADIFRMGFGKRIKYIYYPELRLVFLSSLKVALGLCFKSGIAAEVIGYPFGSVGEAMYQSKLSFDMPELLSYTVVIVLISVLCEKAVSLLLGGEKK